MFVISRFGNFFFRISQPETVQFFQFDAEGNMYMFEAGVGCSGVPKLVRPGDELFSHNLSKKSAECVMELVQPIDIEPSPSLPPVTSRSV